MLRPAYRRAIFLIGAAAWCLPILWAGLRLTVWTPPGFTRPVFAELGERGVATASTARDADLAFMSAPHGPRRHFSARWRGAWYVDRAGTYQLYLGADDWARLSIDGVAIAERSGALGHGTVAVPRELGEGWHTVDIQYEQEGGGAFVTTGWSAAGHQMSPWTAAVVFPAPASSSA